MFAINKHNTAIDGKIGSIPFSGKSIPPDKKKKKKINNAINKTFIIKLNVFSIICLFLFLKLNKLKAPTKTSTTQTMLTRLVIPKTSTSCAVINKNTAAKTASIINIL